MQECDFYAKKTIFCHSGPKTKIFGKSFITFKSFSVCKVNHK